MKEVADEYIFDLGEALYNEETGEAVFNPIIKEKIVRCKNCKYLQHDKSFGYHYCPVVGHLRNYDDFCNFGRNKDEG